eukprot:PITA_19331
MVMQLDIAKDYDKVNWTYIKKVLSAFGFDHNWIRWVVALVTSASFSILVNGSPSDIFLPSRGLRQGDPLSPFLFILMMEGLGRSIKHAKEIGKIQGIQVLVNGQVLTHQQFVEMLQGIPTVKEVLAYKTIMSDLQWNQRIWELLIRKTQDKVKKWTIKSLNLASRLVLAKVVPQAIPVFMISALPAPKGVLQQFRNIQRDFLWGKEETRKQWALVSWEKICNPKNQGGLGLDDPEILSKALGAKLWWQWVKDLEAQWASIWKEKYANSWHSSELIRMKGNRKGSPIWNKAWEKKGVVQNNSFWEIRNEDHTLFWEDKWQQEPKILTEDFHTSGKRKITKD